jgi:nicotinate-nucleotide adenylyltransferase
MSERGRRFGILGGTLDPIHCGHLATAVAARDALALDQVLVLPSGVPPHRQQPLVSPFQRFAMAALAVTGVDKFIASDDELRTDGPFGGAQGRPSYTADTLERQHARGMSASQIFFITGADAFAEIDTWMRYPDVLDLANFVVVARPGYAVSALRGRLPALAGRMRDAAPRDGEESATPLIYLLDVPTPDVSSSKVRSRLARGESISGLVPALVETYINQHALYRSLHGQN